MDPSTASAAPSRTRVWFARAAGGAAGFAALLGAGCASEPARNPDAAPARVVVGVLTRDVSPGERIGPENAELRDLPLGSAEGAQTVLHGFATERMFAGEPVLQARTARVTSGVGVQALVPAGRRAELLAVPPSALLGIEEDAFVQWIVFDPTGPRHDATFHRVLAIDPRGSLLVERDPIDVAEGVGTRRVPVLAPTLDAIGRDQHGPLVFEPTRGERPPAVHAWVAVAARDLTPGVTITHSDVVIRDLDVSGAVTLKAPDAFLDVRARAPIHAGEVIRTARLADPDAGRGLHAVIPRGTVSLGVPAPRGTLIDPGAWVDVFAGEHVFPSVFVLGAADGMLGLLLTPGQATELAGWDGTWEGGLRFALRTELDR